MVMQTLQWLLISHYLQVQQQQYASLGVELGTKTGNYHDIGPFNYTVTARTVTIWIIHGVGPYSLDYNYIVLLNVSLQAIPALIEQYNKEQVFSCISTDNFFDGTMWSTLKRASFVLWDNITTTFSCKNSLFEINVQLNDAGAYLFSENTTDFTVMTSHPMRVNGMMKVSVDRAEYSQ
jgi:hypothetical protein